MDRLSRKVLAFIRRWSLLKGGDRVVLALSGGPDSVALALILLELGANGELPLRLHLAHLNHALRGEESDREEAFCRDFAEQQGLDLAVETIDVAARARGRSVEAAARHVRYGFLGRVARAKGAAAVATAHHADDVAESVLLRMIRGAGIRGLGAMPPRRPLSREQPGLHLVRPLMETRKSHLLDFLRARGQPFCTDSSNVDVGHTRNRIRHRLIHQRLHIVHLIAAQIMPHDPFEPRPPDRARGRQRRHQSHVRRATQRNRQGQRRKFRRRFRLGYR